MLYVHLYNYEIILIKSTQTKNEISFSQNMICVLSHSCHYHIFALLLWSVQQTVADFCFSCAILSLSVVVDFRHLTRIVTLLRIDSTVLDYYNLSIRNTVTNEFIRKGQFGCYLCHVSNPRSNKIRK